MNQDWEDKFKRWAAPLEKTEEERYSNAEKALGNAINASDKLNGRNIKIFTQGSPEEGFFALTLILPETIIKSR